MMFTSQPSNACQRVNGNRETLFCPCQYYSNACTLKELIFKTAKIFSGVHNIVIQLGPSHFSFDILHHFFVIIFVALSQTVLIFIFFSVLATCLLDLPAELDRNSGAYRSYIWAFLLCSIPFDHTKTQLTYHCFGRFYKLYTSFT